MIVVDLQQHGRRDRAGGHQADQHAGEQRRARAARGRRAGGASSARSWARSREPALDGAQALGTLERRGSPATKSHSVWR